jgi:hypothetical protein
MINPKRIKRSKAMKSKMSAFANLLMFLPFIGLSAGASAQVPAFPGAEGFGAMTTGGRGGSVIEVTNLNDSGEGSLRAAIQASGARTVVFRISGTIALQSRLSIKNNNITIAGQTAPGDGICLKNYTLTIDADNVIIRYIRSRLGDVDNVQDDAINGRRHRNIILDHCSMSWSVDECGSFYDNQDFTMQWCLLSESLYESVHDKGRHGYGGIWGGQGATFHHNLLAHHSSRNPRFCGSRYSNQPDLEKIDHRNNVIYNWGGNSCYGAEGGSYNMVDNYYKYGPATSSGVRDRIIHPDADDGTNSQPAGVRGKFYITGNYVWRSSLVTENNWNGVDGLDAATKEAVRLDEPVVAPAITDQNAEVAFEHVLADVGAVLPARDPLDRRIIRETMTGTATYGGVYGAHKGIIDTQTTVGGWPVLNSTTAPVDTDHDGMPDGWEDSMGLDKNDAADRNGDKNGNGYTDLEDYLNNLAEGFRYVIRPLHLTVDTVIGDAAVGLSWIDASDNETGFKIERKDGESWTEVGTVAADDTSFQDKSIPGGGVYYYRMKACTDAVESFYTDSVQALVVSAGILTPLNDGRLNLRVWPNPATRLTQVSYTLTELSDVNLDLFDVAGRHVLSFKEARQPAGEYSTPLPWEKLGRGIYLLRLSTGNSLSVTRVIITR